MEERNGLTIKDLLIRLILIIIFIFLLIWLFPMPDLKPLNNQIFADNMDRMKDVAKSYYTVERLPGEINASKRMTLKEMINSKLILPLMDSNGKYCSEDSSYIEITKLENEYIIKTYLSCTDKQDYVITHFGCYDICSDTCKNIEATEPGGKTTNGRVTTTKNGGTIYEYQFVRNKCTEEFEKYVCPTGYYLVGDTCIKNGSQTITLDAKKNVSNITKTDTKDAKPIIDSSTEIVDAICRNEPKVSTIDANPSSSLVDAELKTKLQTVTARKINSYDVKGAVITKRTVNSDYIKIQNYEVITATKYVAEYQWTYVSTITSDKSGLGYVGENEKIILVDIESVPTCGTCTTMVNVYTYYKYQRQPSKYSYSCDAFASQGYELYGEDKCRRKTNITTKCPDSSYTDTGSGCTKIQTSMSCSNYGSDYVLNEAQQSCTKTTTRYECSGIGDPTSDPRYCTRTVKEYECPYGTSSVGNKKCSRTTYSCPPNTANKTYVLNGSKCTVTENVRVCSCPAGTTPTADETKCAKPTTSTRYTCEDYPGYDLNGKKCTKTITEQVVTYSCEAGFTLNADKCIKTISTTDSKKADKKYRTSCSEEYMWSTRTAISGWTYTGTKRGIK